MNLVDEKMRLSYWFPLIEAAGVPVPKTIIIGTQGRMDDLLDGKTPEHFPLLIERITTAAKVISETGPWFLRTDFTSAKHDWDRSCFVTDLAKIDQHIFNVVEYSAMADMIGLPTDVWAVREMLPVKPRFHAFRGMMPITREFRFFVRDDEVEHEQFYWPAKSLEEGNPQPLRWRNKYQHMSEYTGSRERAALYELARKVSRAVPGYWSVDMLETERGWYVTDMAEGERSFKWSANG